MRAGSSIAGGGYSDDPMNTHSKGASSAFALSYWLFSAAELLISSGNGNYAGLSLHWTNNILTVSGSEVPGGRIQIWYLEAFCRAGSTHREWGKTTIPHRTEFVSFDEKQQVIKLRTHVEPAVEVLHEI